MKIKDNRYLVKDVVEDKFVDDEKIVIYKQFGKYYTTTEANYKARIQNARAIHEIPWAEKPQDIIDYYKKYGWADSDDEFIVIN